MIKTKSIYQLIVYSIVFIIGLISFFTFIIIDNAFDEFQEKIIIIKTDNLHKQKELIKDVNFADMVYFDKEISKHDSDGWLIFGKNCTKVEYFNELASADTGCNNTKTIDNVLRMTKKGMTSEIGLEVMKTLTLSLENIKVRKKIVDSGTFWCTASLKILNEAGNNLVPLTYSSDLDEFSAK